MDKLNIFRFFNDKKGEESGGEGFITTLIVIILAVITFGLLIYWIWRFGNGALPKK